MLDRINFDTYNRPIESFDVDQYEFHRYNLDPPYQRASVWTPEQRVSLIKSIMQGLPIGVIFLNDPKNDGHLNVVDGKQRVETFQAWFRGEFAVPAEWFDPAHVSEDHGYGGAVTFLDLTTVGQRLWRNSALIAVYESHLPESQEPELYERINYGGTPHESLDAGQLYG